MKPLGNIKKFRAEVADLVKKAAAKSFFANRSMLGYEDSDSLDAQVYIICSGHDLMWLGWSLDEKLTKGLPGCCRGGR